MDNKTELEELEEFGVKSGEVDFDEQIANIEKPHIKSDPEPAPAALPPDSNIDEAIAIENNVAIEREKHNEKTHSRMAAAICAVFGFLVMAMLLGSLVAVAKMQDTIDKSEKPSTTEVAEADEAPAAEEQQAETIPEEQASTVETEAPEERWIGSDELGYLKIETYWRQISLADSAITNRAIYENGNYYITMADAGVSSKTPAEMGEEWKTRISTEGAESVELGIVEMNDIVANLLQGYYREQNIWTKTWFYKTSDGHLRYITVEGPSKTNKYFAIPNTYRLSK